MKKFFLLFIFSVCLLVTSKIAYSINNVTKTNTKNISAVDSNEIYTIARYGHGQPQEMLKQIRKGADINKKDPYGRTPLFYAIFTMNLDMIKFLTKHGADVTIKDEKGDTPLHTLTSTANPTLNLLPIINLLVKYGAKINEKNEAGQTPIYEALVNRFPVDALKVFLKHGARLNVRDGNYQNPLHFTLLFSDEYNPATVKFLLKNAPNKAWINQQDAFDSGNRPIDYAVNEKNSVPELAELLIDAGAKIHFKNGSQITLLHDLFLSEHDSSFYIALLKLLAENGMKVDAGDRWSLTPLDYALKSSLSYNVIESLLKAGAYYNVRDSHNVYLHTAENNYVGREAKHIIKLLKEYHTKNNKKRSVNNKREFIRLASALKNPYLKCKESF